MLQLKKIKKTYITGDEKVEALKGIDLSFRESEFVSILGQSGCGKTTLLNIIGGLDRYTSGDLIIKGKSTKDFKDRDWDAYRNYSVGFVFQSYNLIGHQTILSNVELALTIGGVSKKERRERAIKALTEVGLENHINKRPNQLSGGQMQRVAIARALVNNPDIILADEPTGALDTKTSIQIMEILKKISKDKLIIMVTHNPELAEKYSSRIIKILDGKITEDSNPVSSNEEKTKAKNYKRTKMKFTTALRLSLNNLLTKKGRTILISFAGSIGIIGIALITSVSNGFQGYIDHIQEDTLTSYPLRIQNESADLTSIILSIGSSDYINDGTNVAKEKQFLSNMFSNIRTNDLKTFNNYLKENFSKIDKDVSSIEYSYNIDPLIYTIDAKDRIVKLNPNDLFTSMYGSSGTMSMYSSYVSIFSQMADDMDMYNDKYDVLIGSWPKEYNELAIVLSEPNTISDLLVYSLGLRDTDELSKMVTAIMSGESVDISNEPLEVSYEDLLNLSFKLILPKDLYTYNERYNVYEDMTDDVEYMKEVYNNADNLKIVGIICPKEGTTSLSLNSGVLYTSKLIEHIVDTSKDSEIVQKQLENTEIDVFSNNRFDTETKTSDLDLESLIAVDENMIKSAFGSNVDASKLTNMTTEYMNNISSYITVDIKDAKNAFDNLLSDLINILFSSVNDTISLSEINSYTESIVNKNMWKIQKLENDFVIPAETFKDAYLGLLRSLLTIYIPSYAAIDSSLTIDVNNPVAKVDNELKNTIVTSFLSSEAIIETSNTMAKYMTEAVTKKNVLTKVGELTQNLTGAMASSFNVDANKLKSAFSIGVSDDELTRIVTSLFNNDKATWKSNLSKLGFQDLDDPSYMSIYFYSFDGKENFIKFIDEYNENVRGSGNEELEIKYTDTTGILMSSVKTIVNAVSYVLIAFVSISLVVSSIMIGIITYISVYERTKEIGILRAIGASKRNISSIFNAETFIIGLLSGGIGIGISYIVIPIINSIIYNLTHIKELQAYLGLETSALLIVLSIILTLIGGLIPAKAASKKDPVIALRTE